MHLKTDLTRLPLCFALALVLLGGCAVQNKYIEPESRKPVSSKSASGRFTAGLDVIDRGRPVVWQQLTDGASRAGFIVESQDENAWTMQLRYTGDPRDYIDCGRVISKVKASSGERNYDFPAAKAFQQYQLQRDGKIFLVDRRMNLDARATLNLEVLDRSHTQVKIASEYVATRDQSVRGGGAKPFGVTDRIRFDASGGATFPNAATKCRATGKFEVDILSVVRR